MITFHKGPERPTLKSHGADGKESLIKRTASKSLVFVYLHAFFRNFICAALKWPGHLAQGLPNETHPQPTIFRCCLPKIPQAYKHQPLLTRKDCLHRHPAQPGAMPYAKEGQRKSHRTATISTTQTTKALSPKDHAPQMLLVLPPSRSTLKL